MPKFQRSSKSQAEHMQILLDAGWTEDQSRDIHRNGDNSLYLWRWRQPKTRALFTLRDAIAIVEAGQVTHVTAKKR